MAAPFIIPFNHQPVNTNVTTSTYTVPSGKYARVCLKNTILPLLNGTALYVNKTFVQSIPAVTSTAMDLSVSPIKNVHRINATKSGAADNIYLALKNTATVVATSTNNSIALIGSNASSSLIMQSPCEVFGLSAIASVASSTISSLTADVLNIDWIWLKAADAITFNSGNIIFEEYNVIS